MARNRTAIAQSEVAIASLLEQIGRGGDFTLHLLKGGSNNKVFRVESSGGPLLLKVYFQHSNDRRDRLNAEFSFCRFAWENGLRSIPEPLASDSTNHLGLYEFIAGRLLEPREITQERVEQALDFYQELNRYRGKPEAQTLPAASDACFTLAQHLERVENRLGELKKVDDSLPIHHEARDFVQRELEEAWKKVRESVLRRSKEIGLSLEEDPFKEDHRLSPSDFGFHNAILTPHGKLRFIDFEYAGWDDPIQVACNFLCLRGVPVPEKYYSLVLNEVVSDLSDPEIHRKRFSLLMPVHQIKWCCILLNHFRQVGIERRRFAQEIDDLENLKRTQLGKARNALREFYQRGFISNDGLH